MKTTTMIKVKITVLAILFSVALPVGDAAAAAGDLGPGDSGPAVVALQEQLQSKGFYRESITGTYGEATEAAVMALTKELGVARSTSYSGSLSNSLDNYPGPWLPARNEVNRLEVNLSKQVMYLVLSGTVEAIFPVSTGRPGYASPPGDYELFFFDEGWTGGHENYGTYSEWFYTTGLSVHGYHSVPSYPYSHGCVRVHYWDADYLATKLFIGLPIHLWFEPPHYEPAGLSAVPPGDNIDDIVSYDRETGAVVPLQLLAEHGEEAGFVQSGGGASISPGYDLATRVVTGSEQLVVLYDQATGVLQYLSVDETGLARVEAAESGTRGWTHMVPGDFDGDGATDLLFYRASDGLIRFFSVDAAGTRSPMTPVMDGTNGWTSLVAGDFDGDGSDDVFWYRARDGLMRFYSIETGGVFTPMTQAMYGTRHWSDIPSGDFDGDGSDDVMYYREADGLYRFYTIDGDGRFTAISPVGYMSPDWSQILTGEFDDVDGTDLAFYAPSRLATVRYSPGGIRSIGYTTNAPFDQLLVTIDWS